MTMQIKPILIYISLISFAISGCVTNRAMVIPGKDFKQYKYAYIEILPKDNFNLGSRIINELSDIGLQVKIMDRQSFDPSKLSNGTMKVQYSYVTSWDIAIYLRSFQIVFYDAQDDTLIANISYHLMGNIGTTDMRFRAAFNEFRKQLGLPLKQEKDLND